MSAVEHHHTKEQYCCGTRMDGAVTSDWFSVPDPKKCWFRQWFMSKYHMLALKMRGTELGNGKSFSHWF